MPPPAVVFLGPPPTLADQTEAGQERRAVKRPRVGSVSTLQAQKETLSQTVRGTFSTPRGSTSDEMEHDPIQPRMPMCSSSEFGAETDAESNTNAPGSTRVQALNTQGHSVQRNLIDSDDAFVSVGLPSTSRHSLLGPSSRALIKNCSLMLSSLTSLKAMRQWPSRKTRLAQFSKL